MRGQGPAGGGEGVLAAGGAVLGPGEVETEEAGGEDAELQQHHARTRRHQHRHRGAHQLLRHCIGGEIIQLSKNLRHQVLSRIITETEKAPTWLKAATTAFTFKTLLRHYAKRALTPR